MMKRAERKRRMKRAGRMGNLSFMAVTLFLVLAAAYFCTATAMSRTDLSNRELEAYYCEKEQELVEQTRSFLDREGFVNSGVMLTRVVDEEGRRQYTLTVHHGKIDKMAEEDRDFLQAELGRLVFLDANCSFRHEFLINR